MLSPRLMPSREPRRGICETSPSVMHECVNDASLRFEWLWLQPTRRISSAAADMGHADGRDVAKWTVPSIAIVPQTFWKPKIARVNTGLDHPPRKGGPWKRVASRNGRAWCWPHGADERVHEIRQPPLGNASQTGQYCGCTSAHVSRALLHDTFLQVRRNKGPSHHHARMD